MLFIETCINKLFIVLYFKIFEVCAVHAKGCETLGFFYHWGEILDDAVDEFVLQSLFFREFFTE